MDSAPAKKTCMICQPHGIGDILFIQKIIRNYADFGYRVVVPIAQNLSWLRAYLAPHEDIAYPLMTMNNGAWYGDFKFASIFLGLHEASRAPADTKELSFKSPIVYNGGDPENGFTFIALGSSYQWLNDNMMTSKYRFVGLDHSDWADHVHLKRRPHVEKELYYDVLGLKDDSCYTLVNEMCSSKTITLDVPGNVVRLRLLDAFTLLDWLLVIEKAAQIVTVDTSLVILTEILKQKKPLYMVSRYEPPRFDEVKDILKMDWTFVPTAAELKINPVG
ncbi:MAG: hypothetical protein WC464_05685 [Bdellovibrionales bacterium]